MSMIGLLPLSKRIEDLGRPEYLWQNHLHIGQSTEQWPPHELKVS